MHLIHTRAEYGPPLPPGVVPNYINPPSIGGKLVAACSILTALAFVFVILRLAAKRHKAGRWSWDDGLIVMALLLAIGRNTLGIVAAKDFAAGTHIWDIPPEFKKRRGNSNRNLILAGDMLYFAGVLCTKNAILMMYVNLFRPRKIFRWACYSMMAFVSVYLTLFFFLWAFDCSPVARGWHLVGWRGGGSCLDIYAQNYAAGAINIFSDVVILIMPLPLLKALQLDRFRKYGLIAVFLTGVFAVACTIIREVIVVKIFKSSDMTWSSVEPYIWMSAEFCVGIICACMPHLAPAFTSVVSTIMPSLRSVRRHLSLRFESTRSPRLRTKSLADIPQPLINAGQLGNVSEKDGDEIESGGESDSTHGPLMVSIPNSKIEV